MRIRFEKQRQQRNSEMEYSLATAEMSEKYNPDE